jgi:regulator of RNase E activity RraA
MARIAMGVATLLERLARLDCCAVSDALDALGLPGATTGVGRLWPVEHALAGVARTVTAGPKTQGGPAAHIAASAIDSASEGDVIVVANGGRLDVSCWGGILTRAARYRGIRGVVIDGACRDIAEGEQLGFPVFGRAVVPVSARGRIVQVAAGDPVDFAGVRVEQGDLVLADRDGVVFIPRERAADVIAFAGRVVAREEQMAAAVLAGEPVTAVMHDTKFPVPKTPEEPSS